MKPNTTLIALSALASQASAHYIFNQLSYGGTKFPVQQYVRPNTNYNSPVTDLKSTDLRCNVGGSTGSGTQTVTVKAGDAFTFFTDTPVYHNGPLAIYMAKAPSTAASFDGSGQVWFKIYQLGPTFDAGGNAVWPLAGSYTANIPAALPSGEYLLRIEQIGIHNPYPAGLPQFYIGCAQVTVTGGGSGTPGPLVSIPGWIDGTEAGYTVNIYSNFHEYSFLGPAVWTGGSGSGPSPSPSRTVIVSPPVLSTTKPPTTTSTKAPTTTTTKAPTTTTTKAPTTATTAKPTTATPSPTGAAVPKFGQCGGSGWKGATACASGSTCKAANEYYSQCL